MASPPGLQGSPTRRLHAAVASRACRRASGHEVTAHPVEAVAAARRCGRRGAPPSGASSPRSSNPSSSWGPTSIALDELEAQAS
eukprot:5489359-Heterocapsa_arctica.AAC.1